MEKRSLKELKPLAALLWILGPGLGAACGYFGAKAVSLAAMRNISGWSEEEIENADSFWCVTFPKEHMQEDMITKFGIIAAVLGVLAIACLVGLMIMTGRFNQDENGRPVLNLFDRIWTEIHLAVCAAAAFFAVYVCWPMVELWPITEGQGYTTTMTDDHWFGPNNEFIFYICVAGCFCCLLIAMLTAVTLIKKLKARQFLRGSLIGLILGAVILGIRHVWRTIFRSDKYMRKYILVGIGMILLAMTWIGAIVDLALIFIFVPKFVKKFRTIREGVTEVKSGNLTYKIPVDSDEKGPVTGLDSLARDINEISQATNVAVQNELKNQRLKTDLISNVSHDLKTPLTSMITYVDLMKNEGLDSENAPEYLEIIDEKTHRLKNLTENLFEAAKASSGNIPCEISDIDITAIVNQALAEMEDRLAEHELNVIVKNELESPTVRADGQLLCRVIENLLSNVSKYAQEGSRVYINLSESTSNPAAGKGHALLEVKNISKDALNIPADELMERFKRGDESRNTEGSGLGLAIAKDLTHLMGGVFEITIDGDLFKASVMLEKA